MQDRNYETFDIVGTVVLCQVPHCKNYRLTLLNLRICLPNGFIYPLKGIDTDK